MDEHFWGMQAALVINGLLFFLGVTITKLIWRRRVADSSGDDRPVLPGPTVAYVAAGLVAGFLAVLVFFLLGKASPGEQALKQGMFLLTFFLFCHWVVDAGMRRQYRRGVLMYVVPYVAGLWLAAGVLALVMR